MRLSDEAYCVFIYDDGLQDGFFRMENELIAGFERIASVL
jgi:hypothetical protein